MVDIINELVDYGVSVDIVDPHANAAEVKHEYGLDMIELPLNIEQGSEHPSAHLYDAIIVAVSHKDYLTLDETYFQTLTTPQAVLADVKGLYRSRIHNLTYWSL